MATPGELRLVGFQELQVGLGDGQWARIGSVVAMSVSGDYCINVL